MTTLTQPGQPEGLRERKKVQTRRALHRAALELICEQGPTAITIDDITERAGASRRTFFNYYPSRDAALTWSNPEAVDHLMSTISQAPAGMPVPQILRTAVAAWLGAATRDAELARLRRQAIESWPDFATMVAIANSTLTREVLATLLAREDVEDCMENRIALMVTMDVARAVYMDHAAQGYTGDLPALMDRGFDTLREVAAAL